jgi:hypothetical protein
MTWHAGVNQKVRFDETIRELEPFACNSLFHTHSETPMNVNPKAPVLTRDEILINAPLSVVWKTQTDISAWPRWRPQVPMACFDGNLAVGSVFHWEEGGCKTQSKEAM